MHGLIKPIVSPPKLCGILIHFIVPRGTPRKNLVECAARFLKLLTIYDENLQFFLPYLWFKGKVCIWAKWPNQAGAYPGFYSMKQLRVFLLPPPPGWDARSITGLPPSIKFASTHIHLGGERHCESKSVLPKNTTQCPRPGLEPGPDRKSVV